jgi:hypothetical protein
MNHDPNPEATFEVSLPTMLYARGNEQQLVVTRSPIIPEDDELWKSVLDHIAEHGLVLMESVTKQDEGSMFGERETLWYGKPELRNELMSDLYAAHLARFREIAR